MIDALITSAAFIAKCVETIVAAAIYTVDLNYEIVAAIVNAVSTVIALLVSAYSYIKPFLSKLLEIFMDIYSIIKTLVIMLITSMQLGLNAAHLGITCLIQLCHTCFHYITCCYLMLKHCLSVAVGSITTSLQTVFAFIFSTITSIFFCITSLGSLCVSFVTGVWQGLGFVFSSVAYFPVYCMQCIDAFVENSWRNVTNTCVHILNATTKETYLGIVLLCLLYLTLSNFFRYMNSRGITLFPQRFRGRSFRIRETTLNWNIDRGFESDFEDMYGSDAEDVAWAHEINQTNVSEGDSSSDDDDSVDSFTRSSGVSDSDSDEYTIVTEESDSDASINSQTFSTESSDHEIEVQLPKVDERYSLRNRSSTPSHMPKAMNCPEDFDREMERERDKRKCVVCQDEIKSVLVLPCKHLCMCVVCADQIVRSQITGRRVCPLCRTKITKVMNIYV
ncbi:uncharacterized protein LOC106051122 [Biomphalaria glabrata]|uniref:Uncharacterized protein LOC106051122 n=1 Tax=Biomphalaria glabrata TaxID=6526 RepID=A0A9U8DUW9_BIOGL|nr:uncharacterized protein LOC106051122 [Biomphalaria glabrata]